MNFIIETCSQWGESFTNFAGQMFWQSSLLIGAVFAFDLALRRQARAAVRYALWIVVLVKLALPPTLAFPTSFAWWLRPVEAPRQMFQPRNVVATYKHTTMPALPSPDFTPVSLPSPRASGPARLLAGSSGVSLALMFWLLVRWLQVSRDVRRAAAPPESHQELLANAVSLVGLKSRVRLRITNREMSPAVCGLLRPVILLPEKLADNLPASQLRAVLIHELMHLKRGDVWINCLQSLLQIIYWWHPLVWFANARIRRAREEAVDDAVMLALRENADSYAPTLLKVAKLSFHRPLASLGLVGILESRSALRQRIERLLDFKMPRRAGLSFVSILGIAAFTTVAVPMAEAPVRSTGETAIQARDGRDVFSSNSLAAFPVAAAKVLPNSKRTRLMAKADELEDQTAAVPATAATNSSERHLIYPSPARQAIVNKLQDMRFDRVAYDGRPLSEVIRNLSAEVKARDPDGLGINFTINSVSSALADATLTSTNEAVDINSVVIKINPALRDVRLVDALDAIVAVADHPIKYSIRDGGIVFSAKGNESEPLVSRRFKVDATILIQGLVAVSGDDVTSALHQNSVDAKSRTNSMARVQSSVMDFFRGLGVNLDPPKSIYFNHTQGTLWVRATAEDLGIIENAIQEFYQALPQLNIRVKFIELITELPGAFSVRGPLTNHDGRIVAALPPERAKQFISDLRGKTGVRELSDGQITTLSGRQAQLQIGEVKTVVVGITNGLYETKDMMFGQTLDVVPYLDADGYTIHLTLIPSVTEFLGYDDPKSNKLIPGSATNYLVRVHQPLPHFRSRQTTISAMMRDDGQTILLDNLTQTETVLSNGVSSTKQVPEDPTRYLMILITPTLIDPTGNRIHSDEELDPLSAISR